MVVNMQPVVNPDSGRLEFKSEEDLVLETVLLDAKQCAQIKLDFVYFKDVYKNKVLHAYASNQFVPQHVE